MRATVYEITGAVTRSILRGQEVGSIEITDTDEAFNSQETDSDYIETESEDE